MSDYTDRFERQTEGLAHLSIGIYPSRPCAECAGSGHDDDDEDRCHECRGTGLDCDCPDCARHWQHGGTDDDEGGFSWQDCDTCNSRLGGTRHAAHALMDDDPRRTVVHLAVCTDCVMFVANGDEPDEPDE